MKYLIVSLTILLTFSACVSKKKYLEIQALQVQTAQDLEKSRLDLEKCREDLATAHSDLLLKATELEGVKNQVSMLEAQIETFKKTNTNLLDRLADLSVINVAGAENIKKSLEAINSQSAYIQDLTTNIQRKDSLNLALVTNLKRALPNTNDEDITIEVKKGVVFISISDKMLFKSGSFELSDRAGEVLSKVALIINDHQELEVLVEGHTDNVPISNSCLKDNWDLSVKRATSVVRSLQTQYKVDPARMTAGGRGEYLPKTSNATSAGRSDNRRTEIILLPKLDQFFELIKP